jgi:succinate dehydrogenase iron-sulfur subunit
MSEETNANVPSKAYAPVEDPELGAKDGKTAKLRIFRGDAEGGEEVEYEIPLVEGMVVLDAVLYIQAHQASDLAVRWNCKAAHCGSCSAEINGRPKLMCKTRVEEFEGGEIHVHPLRAFRVIKDLVSDVSWNYEVSRGITSSASTSRRSASSALCARTSATCCAPTTSTPNSPAHASSCGTSGSRCTRWTRRIV